MTAPARKPDEETPPQALEPPREVILAVQRTAWAEIRDELFGEEPLSAAEVEAAKREWRQG